VFGVALIVFEAAGKAARADDHLAGFGVVAMRLFAGEGFAGDFLEDAFADADGGDEELTDVEVTAEDDKDDGGDAHDVGAVAADTVGFHAFADIAFEDVREAFAEERDVKGGETFATRAGRNVRESFGVAAEGDG